MQPYLGDQSLVKTTFSFCSVDAWSLSKYEHEQDRKGVFGGLLNQSR